MPLTEREVRGAKPTPKPYKIADGGGLFVLVTPPGGKLWRYAYRFKGKSLLMTFGAYPDVSLAQAREKHREARAILAGGVDPMDQRKRDKKRAATEREDSFEHIAGLWLKHWREGKSARHVANTESRLKDNVFPALGMRPISQIDAPEVVTMVLAIANRGRRELAKRALETTGQIFRFAIARGLARRNPAAEVKPRDLLQPSQRENHARILADELPALLLKIELYPGTHLTRLAMQLIALTFLRTGELIEAPWVEIDLPNRRWNIPAGRMKMRTAHIVPLAEQTIAVLQSIRSLTHGSDLIFPHARDRKRTMSNNTILKGLERIGYKHRMTGHGFRGLASTILHERGYPHEHIELQLAHAPRNAVSAAYNHALYLAPRAQMMQDWADYLDGALSAGREASIRSRIQS